MRIEQYPNISVGNVICVSVGKYKHYIPRYIDVNPMHTTLYKKYDDMYTSLGSLANNG